MIKYYFFHHDARFNAWWTATMDLISVSFFVLKKLFISVTKYFFNIIISRYDHTSLSLLICFGSRVIPWSRCQKMSRHKLMLNFSK